MPVHPHPGVGPAPERGDHNPDGAKESTEVTGNLPSHSDGGTDGASLFAHGTHGRGDSRRQRRPEVEPRRRRRAGRRARPSQVRRAARRPHGWRWLGE